VFNQGNFIILQILQPYKKCFIHQLLDLILNSNCMDDITSI
jgi:hypothetical protein